MTLREIWGLSGPCLATRETKPTQVLIRTSVSETHLMPDSALWGEQSIGLSCLLDYFGRRGWAAGAAQRTPAHLPRGPEKANEGSGSHCPASPPHLHRQDLIWSFPINWVLGPMPNTLRTPAYRNTHSLRIWGSLGQRNQAGAVRRRESNILGLSGCTNVNSRAIVREGDRWDNQT